MVDSKQHRLIRVWDPLVRFGHWALVMAFFTAYFTEDEWLSAHVWAGYLVGAVVIIRILWGFVGTRHARFSDFVRSPATVIGYFRDLAGGRAKRYIGHNPAGGVMIVIMLLTLVSLTWSGLMVYALEERAGPLAGWVSSSYALPAEHAQTGEHDSGGESAAFERAEDFWEETHEILANLMLALVLLHIAAVLISSRLHRENLVRAMVTGRKQD